MTAPARTLALVDLAVVIPTLNEARALPQTIAAVKQAWPHADIVVVDGSSTDNTVTVATGNGARVINSPRGRGRQLAAGAQATSAAWILFLHADTQPGPDAAAALAQWMASSAHPVATFRLQFASHNFFLRACAWTTRFDSVLTRFGDQGIVTSRAAYHSLGGFPDWPLFEDVDFLRHARRHFGRVVSLPATVITSARRFQTHGTWRQQARNARLLLRFLLGASPHELATRYESPPASAVSPAE